MQHEPCHAKATACLPVYRNLRLQCRAVGVQSRHGMGCPWAWLLQGGLKGVVVWDLGRVCRACRSQGTLALVGLTLLHPRCWPAALCCFPAGCFTPALQPAP